MIRFRKAVLPPQPFPWRRTITGGRYGVLRFPARTGKQVELKPETLKAEIGEIGYNANAYEVLVEDAT